VPRAAGVGPVVAPAVKVTALAMVAAAAAAVVGAAEVAEAAAGVVAAAEAEGAAEVEAAVGRRKRRRRGKRQRLGAALDQAGPRATLARKLAAGTRNHRGSPRDNREDDGTPQMPHARNLPACGPR
jgi:hypothetical protein